MGSENEKGSENRVGNGIGKHSLKLFSGYP